MVVNGRPFKRLKRRVTADLYDFLTFPSEGSELRGPFRTNVRSFLSKHARLPPPSSLFSPNAFPHLLKWQILFRVGGLSDGELSYPGAVVALDVVEEEVTRSRSVYCDQCRVVGWSGHPVCVKRYHFIIGADNKSTDGNHACPTCRAALSPADIRCRICNNEITGNDAEDSVLNQLEDATHLLHGVIHTNGYGHLLRVNGREGGSKFLSGRQIMDFWDRLCTTLQVRKISVIDVSKKFGMDFRLLHALTNGRSWYGNWGYEFLAGSFALTSESYHAAVKELSDTPVAFFCADGNDSWLREVTACYMTLSGQRLATVKDLFRFILKLLEHTRKEGVDSKTSNRYELPLSHWSDVDVKRAECAMIKVLKTVDSSRWVAMKALRGAAFRAGPPQLLDYCMKQLGGRVFDTKIVDVRLNPITKMAEYRLCDRGEALHQPIPVVNSTLDYPSGAQLFRDLRSLYDTLLNSHAIQASDPTLNSEVHNSVVRLLDCKQFIKDYGASNTRFRPKSSMMYAFCEITLNDQPVDYRAPPSELVVLQENATIGELKREASKAFQDVYIMFRRLNIEELTDYNHIVDSAGAALIGTDSVIRVRGRCYDNAELHPYRMERGIETWTVECACGAKDDDGERMMACDKCEVWHHTRCAGISDGEAVPVKFICIKCGEHPASAVEVATIQCFGPDEHARFIHKLCCKLYCFAVLRLFGLYACS